MSNKSKVAEPSQIEGWIATDLSYWIDFWLQYIAKEKPRQWRGFPFQICKLQVRD